jgi:hypothetical protein
MIGLQRLSQAIKAHLHMIDVVVDYAFPAIITELYYKYFY